MAEFSPAPDPSGAYATSITPLRPSAITNSARCVSVSFSTPGVATSNVPRRDTDADCTGRGPGALNGVCDLVQPVGVRWQVVTLEDACYLVEQCQLSLREIGDQVVVSGHLGHEFDTLESRSHRTAGEPGLRHASSVVSRG